MKTPNFLMHVAQMFGDGVHEFYSSMPIASGITASPYLVEDLAENAGRFTAQQAKETNNCVGSFRGTNVL